MDKKLAGGTRVEASMSRRLHSSMTIDDCSQFGGDASTQRLGIPIGLLRGVRRVQHNNYAFDGGHRA